MGYDNPLQNEYEGPRHNEGPWCDDCHGYTHMPWCSEYEQSSSDTEIDLPISDSEKLERFVRATGEPTVMQALMWIQRHRASEQPASARVGEWTLSKPLTNQILADDLRRGNTGTISVYGIDIPETGSERVHFGAVLVFGDKERAEQIIESVNHHQHCATPLQFLANRAEELSSLLARMTTERDGLREALQSIVEQVDDAVDHKIHNGKLPPVGALLSTIQDTARAALNHAEQGEG